MSSVMFNAVVQLAQRMQGQGQTIWFAAVFAQMILEVFFTLWGLVFKKNIFFQHSFPIIGDADGSSAVGALDTKALYRLPF